MRMNPHIKVGVRVRYIGGLGRVGTEQTVRQVWENAPNEPLLLFFGWDGWSAARVWKPVVRVKAPVRTLGGGVPDDAQPGDLVVGNRGAAAEVIQYKTSGGTYTGLILRYAGNWYEDNLKRHNDGIGRVYDQSGGMRP